jgi:outer membrane lipoprotein SlyB
MKTVLSVIVLSVIISGCSSSTLVTPSGEKGDISYPEFNAKLGNDEANIKLKDGRTVSGKSIYASHDTISWNDPKNQSRMSAPVENVHEVFIVNHTPTGFLGLLLGAAVGVGVSLSVTSGPSNGGEGVVWAIAPPSGAAIGAVAGALIGSRTRYEFPKDTTRAHQGIDK